MKATLYIFLALTTFSTLAKASAEEAVQQVGGYQCPRGWINVNQGGLYCANGRGDAVIMYDHAARKIRVIRNGQRDKYCSNWAVTGIFVTCAGN